MLCSRSQWKICRVCHVHLKFQRWRESVFYFSSINMNKVQCIQNPRGYSGSMTTAVCVCVCLTFSWLGNRAFCPSWYVSGRSLDSQNVLCNHCCENCYCTRSILAHTIRANSNHQTSTQKLTESHNWSGETKSIYCHLRGKTFKGTSRYDLSDGRRWRESKKDKYTVPSPPRWLWSPSLISSTEWWRTGSASAERRGTGGGGGRGSCGSHFIKQPGTRQRCRIMQ